MKHYSVKEVAELLGVSGRSVQRRCKKLKVWRKDNIYQITSDFIDAWRNEITATNDTCRDKTTKRHDTPDNVAQLDVEVESLKAEIEDLKEELSQYEIKPGQRYELFTDAEYQTLETRLIEWQTQRLEIEHQEKVFNAEKKSLTEMYEHYKNQFHYQQKQNEKVLEMHQKLLDIISSQSKTMQERNLIEAVEKNIVDKNTWKPNKDV
jgi:hypothetical protein